MTVDTIETPDRIAAAPRGIVRDDAFYRLRADVEDHYSLEGNLLDSREYEAWLDLLDEDISYFMPIRRNVKFGQQADRENTLRGAGISWFDEGKWTLRKRVEQVLTGVHYAEEPLSRVSHLTTNILIVAIRGETGAREIDVSSRFLIYQNRVEYENYTFIGRRNDTLRESATGWKVAAREIILEQNVLLAKNLTIFC